MTRSLFDPPLARATDPETSHAAAAEVAANLGERQAFAVRCVVARPGSTARELDTEFAPGQDRAVGKRLPECERRGLVRRGPARPCRETGRSAETWFPAENGGGHASG